MEYRRIGRAGVKVSALSLGSWVTYASQVDLDAAVELMSAARDHGVNFFDNAEVYALGQSEILMGEALKRLKWDRLTYLVSTKFFWGLKARFGEGVNEKNTLNRKYLRQAIDGSLQRLQLDFVDLVYCHRPDPFTPLEEIVFTMHEMVASGKALYWGTSEWSAADIMGAWQIAERHHLHKPVVEQPEYNLFKRKRVEVEYARLYDETGIGTTTWSPLASGLLSGKYAKGIPAGSRASLKNMAWMKDALTDPLRNAKVADLGKLAAEIGCTTAQLAIAWCVRNPRVSTVITGATKVGQLQENLKSLEVAAKLTPEVAARIDAIVGDDFD
jgi:voltage-dependent potassium channel beta subunit